MKLRRLLLGSAATVVAGFLAINAINANSGGPPPSTLPTNPSGSTGTNSATGSTGISFDPRTALVEPYSNTMPWRQPAATFGRSEALERYVDRYWDYSDRDAWDKPELKGRAFLTTGDYSVPVFDARKATRTRKYFITDWGWGQDGVIPWDDSFTGGGGSDNGVVVHNPDTGEIWAVWADQGANFTGCLGKMLKGYSAFTDMCVGSAYKMLNDDGTSADARNWSGEFVSLGNGMPPMSALVTSWEVASGKIPHALSATVFNPMFGPACAPEQMSTEAAGVDCGFYVAPATRIEHVEGAHTGCNVRNEPNTPAWRSKTIPHGLRLALNVTDDEINQWLDRRGFTEPLRTTARVFAVAMRDYGWIVTVTGCSSVAFQVDGFKNPDSKAIWEQLGITSNDVSATLLDGLMTRDRLYAVTPSPPIRTTKQPAPGRFPN